MQSFKLHIVSEQLKDRHPYLELEFRDRYDPSEVYHAVFDRSITKLIEILQMPKISFEKYRDALITLNEQVSHQENKDIMISLKLVSIVSDYLHCTVPEIRREAVNLLGSLVSIMRGRENVSNETFSGLEKLLFDEEILVREACAWCICRFSSGRDGVEILSKEGLIAMIVKSFLRYSENLDIINGRFLIYLLEGFISIFQYDNGIFFFLKSGLMNRINNILLTRENSEFIETFSHRINYLCLAVLAKCTVNQDGKQEAIDEKVIETAQYFLKSENYQESHFSVVLIMNCSIHLDGKKQCVSYQDSIVIRDLISLLETTNNEDLRLNIKQALINIADLPIGFLVIAKYLAKSVKILDEIFGPKSIKPLIELLPKTSSLSNPPNLPDSSISEYKIICLAICHIIKIHKESIKIVGEETVKTVEKITPFLIFKEKNFQDLVATTLFKILDYDEYSRKIMRKYLGDYGNVHIENMNSTINTEIMKYNEIAEIIDEKNFDYA